MRDWRASGSGERFLHQFGEALLHAFGAETAGEVLLGKKRQSAFGKPRRRLPLGLSFPRSAAFRAEIAVIGADPALLS